jgi:hypothetical protein
MLVFDNKLDGAEPPTKLVERLPPVTALFRAFNAVPIIVSLEII